MKALVYQGPGNKTVEDRPKPELQASGDAIVRITKTTICGTDLHILFPVGEDRLMLVSVGAGSVARPLPGAKLFGQSLLSNAMTVPGALMTSMSVENDINCRLIGRCVHGGRIDAEIGDLIPVEPLQTPRQFLYARYNADISQAGLAALCLGDIKAERLRIDNVAAIPDLLRIGNTAAEAVNLPQQFAPFLAGGIH